MTNSNEYDLTDYTTIRILKINLSIFESHLHKYCQLKNRNFDILLKCTQTLKNLIS